MSDYFLSPQAINDLTEINDYLFANNQVATDTFLDKISPKFERLAQFPKMGRRPDEQQQINNSQEQNWYGDISKTIIKKELQLATFWYINWYIQTTDHHQTSGSAVEINQMEVFKLRIMS